MNNRSELRRRIAQNPELVIIEVEGLRAQLEIMTAARDEAEAYADTLAEALFSECGHPCPPEYQCEQASCKALLNHRARRKEGEK
jgi:hypothetical protein